MQDNAKESCMTSFQLLHSFLQALSYDESKSKRVSERTFMTLFDQDVVKRGKVVLSKALGASLVVNECSRTKSDEHITSSNSGTYITHVMDTDILPVNDQEPSAEEKGFTIAASKNELRKITRNSMNTKFAKPSILGKPVLQPLRNKSVVRQSTVYRSERSKFSKPWFSSQVDVNNVLSKPVTPHYLPKVRKFMFVKPNHVIASGSSRNSTRESYGSNDMPHSYYLEEAKKKTQYKIMNHKPSVMHTTSLQNTTNGSKIKPRSNNQTSRSLPVPKSSRGMLKCVFNANHDDCITKFLKEVNSCAKVQSPKPRNNIKPTKRIPNVNKSERWISKGYKFSPNKSSAVYEKPNTPRSCLRWKPTGRIFKTAHLSIGLAPSFLTPGYICLGFVQNSISPTPYVLPSKKDHEILFQHLFDEYFNPPPRVVSLISAATAALRTIDPAGSPSSTTIDQDVPSASTSLTIQETQSQVTHQAISSDNTQSAVIYTSISSDLDGPSWGIPLMNDDELPEMDLYEEVSQQGQHPEYHSPSNDDIQVEDQPYADDASSNAESPGFIADSDSMGEDDDEDPEEDPNNEHEPENDDEDPEEDPNEDHKHEDEDTKE
uniref:Uncharacterized protein n=1 Tax=Tanacetum cinerariifolium TaxID=118510 RepID=A0A6L2MIF8_TANCI|nr:hypothetical protein [Tanacetum cinerariifolium]